MLFDLDRAQVLGQVFRLDYELTTTDFVERELKTLQTGILKQLGLRVEGLAGTEVAEMYGLRRRYSGPGHADLSALVYAKHAGCTLVTRDRPLADAARDEGVAVRDTLWLLIPLRFQDGTNPWPIG